MVLLQKSTHLYESAIQNYKIGKKLKKILFCFFKKKSRVRTHGHNARHIREGVKVEDWR